MEKRPHLIRGYDGNLTIDSCHQLCIYMAEEAEINDEIENAKDWWLEANLYKAELDLGLVGYSKNPVVEREIERNREAWDAVTERLTLPQSA